jgi:hypothetical protein
VALRPGDEQSIRTASGLILECVGLLTIAVAALELGQTVLEEEVQRAVHVSSPTRLRRFLSRFLIVVVVSLGVECLVGVFQFMHTKPELLPQVASIGVAAAILLASWGVFVRMNVEAEKLEPEAMRQARRKTRMSKPEQSGFVRLYTRSRTKFLEFHKSPAIILPSSGR